MKKVELYDNPDGSQTAMIMCPACHFPHSMRVRRDGQPGPQWGYNFNEEAPTFTPSILSRSGHFMTGKSAENCVHCKEDDDRDMCQLCHSFITDGVIKFLDDCSHTMAGQSMSLPEWPEPKTLPEDSE